MRKLFVSLTVLIGTIMLLTSSIGAKADPSEGKARLHPINHSGIKAKISFLDTGNNVTGLIISGTATGLDPNESYVSLLYDNPSVRGEEQSCNLADNLLDFEEEFAGRWSVEPDGTGTLFRTNFTSAYVPLSRLDAISILREEGDRPPESFELVACGKISKHR
jgi:hypothetical protein